MFFDVLAFALHWPIPNYKNPERRGNENAIVTGIFLTAATICVWTRLYARVFVRRWFGLDDLLIFLSWLSSILITVLVGIGNSRFNWDRHLWDVNPQLYSGAAQLLYFSRLAWGVATSLVRLSVLCLYYRLLYAANAPRRYYIVNHVVLASTVLLLLYYIFSEVFTCTPISGYWSWPSSPDVRCMDDGASLTVSGGVNTLSEFVVATLPVVAVFRLGVAKQQRWAVISVLSLGYLVVLAGCVRTWTLYKLFEHYDLTWWAGPQWICTEVELDVAICCACAAPLRPVFGRIIKRIRGVRPHLPIKPTRSWFSSKLSSTAKDSQISNSVNREYSRDMEALNEWTAAMNRTIDLEGIGKDGFGYTIHIEGPAKKEEKHHRLQFNVVRAGLTNLRPRGRNTKPSRNRSAPTEQQQPISLATALNDITAKTEVAVRESFHSSIHGNKAWGQKYGQRGYTASEKEVAMATGDAYDFDRSKSPSSPVSFEPWNSVTLPEFAIEPQTVTRDLSQNPNFFESVESLEALPAMPDSSSKKTYDEDDESPFYRHSPKVAKGSRRPSAG